MGIMQLGWDPRNAANLLDQLTEWERRIREYEGESLETSSDGMKIAVLASHALESIRNVATLAAGAANGNNRAVRRSFCSLAESSTRMVEEWSRSQTVRTRRRWTLWCQQKQGKGMLRVRTSGSRSEDCKFNQAKGKGQCKGKTKSTSTDKNTPAKFKVECRHCGKKCHKWGRLLEALGSSERQESPRRDGAPSTATVAAVEDTEVIGEAGICGDCSDDENKRDDTNEAWVLSVEGDDKPADAEFLPLDSASEEHTCPWNFAEGGHDLRHSNVHFRNANGLSIPSDKKVMVSYDVLGPGGRAILHAQTPCVQSDVKKRPLLSVGKLTQSGAEVKFGDKSSWIDLQTDAGVQRVPVRVKGETFGLSIQKTDAWIIPETSDRAPHAVVAPAGEEIGRAEQPNRAPAAQEAAAAPRPEETQDMRFEREARDLAASWQSSRWEDSRAAAKLKPVEGAWRTGVVHEGSGVASTRPCRSKA